MLSTSVLAYESCIEYVIVISNVSDSNWFKVDLEWWALKSSANNNTETESDIKICFYQRRRDFERDFYDD